MPSTVGYQPTLSTEMGSFQERIVATLVGSITSIQAILMRFSIYWLVFDSLVCDRWLCCR